MTIRRVPEDFVVEEVIGAGFLTGLQQHQEHGHRRSGQARGTEHAVYRLTKTSLTTPEAIAFLANAIGVKTGVVDYAGLKDKHARTVQLVSVPRGGREFAREVSGRGWSAELIGRSEREVSAEVIEGNRFEIVVRDLTRASAEEMERRAGELILPPDPVALGDIRCEPPATIGTGCTQSRTSAGTPQGTTLEFINYFGEQRFGSARHGKGFAARHLMRGEFEEALRLLIATPARKDSGKRRSFSRIAAEMWGDWKGMLERLPRCPERGAIEALAAGGSLKGAFAALPHFTQQMSVEAYQSWLWNRVGERLAERIHPDDARVMEVPMFAPETVLAEPWKGSALEVLGEEGLTLEELRIPGLRRPRFGEAMRPLVARATGFELGAPEPDDLGRAGRFKRLVKFELGRGSYATVLLRTLGQ